MAPEKKWRRFEDLVADIQRKLSPSAVITLNDRVLGRNSETMREIDISVRDRIGQYEMFIAIECKDYKRLVDLPTIEMFSTKLKDVGAHKGVIVSAKGFSQTALRLARKVGIQLYRPLSSGPHEWNQLTSIPAVADVRFIQSYGLQFTGTAHNTVLPRDFREMVKMMGYRADGSEQGSLIDLMYDAVRRTGAKPGAERQLLSLGQAPLFLRGSRGDFEAQVNADVVVSSNLWFQNLPLDDVQGFIDEETGRMILGSFAVREFRIDDVMRTWTKVIAAADLAVVPMVRLVGMARHDDKGFVSPTFLGFRSEGQTATVTVRQTEEGPAVEPPSTVRGA